MPIQTRIALIHATRLAIEPVETVIKSHWPNVTSISILEEGLEIDRAQIGLDAAAIHSRILALSNYAQSIDVEGILFTCSAFGKAIEAADNTLTIPVLKPNEAMFEAALLHGEKIAMIYTFRPAASTMELEFAEAASLSNSKAELTAFFCEGALDAKRSGNIELHDRLIADTVAKLESYDAILLAQFSMASSAPLASTRTTIPILTSPHSAIEEMRRRIEINTRQNT